MFISDGDLTNKFAVQGHFRWLPIKLCKTLFLGINNCLAVPVPRLRSWVIFLLEIFTYRRHLFDNITYRAFFYQ